MPDAFFARMEPICITREKMQKIEMTDAQEREIAQKQEKSREKYDIN